MPRTAMFKYPLLAIAGIAALSLAACGSSNSGSPSTSSATSGSASTSTSTSTSTSGAPSAEGPDRVEGLIASVSGTTIQVTQPTATVAFEPATKISELTAAQLTDVTPGSCVAVRPARGSAAQSGGAVTARMVLITPAVNGQCQQPRGRGGVGGSVTSVTGNTIVATTTDSNGSTSQTNIQVTDSTRYEKRTVANAQAIAQGKCIAARGTKDSGGTLQATVINLRPANNGSCPQPNGGRAHRGS